MFNKRLLVRSAIASVGALTVFTTALGSPAQCTFAVRGRTLVQGPCDADFKGGGTFDFEKKGERGSLISISIFAAGQGRATGLLNVVDGNNNAYDSLGDLRREGHCWTTPLVRACALRIAARR